MSQQQTGVSTKSNVAPNNTLDHTEFNALNDAINANASDSESRLASLESTSTGILSYTTENLPVSVVQQGSLAFDTTLGELVYFKNSAWYLVSSDSPAVNLWDPSQIPTSYWWDASDISTITETTNFVSAWTDKNQSTDLIQNNAAEQPKTNISTINALNVLDFQQSGWLQGPVFALDQWTKLIVFNFTVSQTNNLLSSASGGFDALWELSSGFLKIYQTNQTIITSTTPMTNGKTFLAGATKATNGDGELFIFGNSEGTANKPLGTGTLPFEVGSFQGANFLWGQIAEVILLPSIINLSDRQKAEGYLAHKWGIHC